MSEYSDPQGAPEDAPDPALADDPTEAVTPEPASPEELVEPPVDAPDAAPVAPASTDAEREAQRQEELAAERDLHNRAREGADVNDPQDD